MKKLIIDAGHGNKDPGAVANGYLEKDLNLIVAKRVAFLLGADLTRSTDEYLSPQDRTNKIKDKYDICLSIHFNAGGGRGIETIHSIFSKNGEKLGRLINEKVSEKTGLPIRRTFSRKSVSGKDYYFMHRLTGRTMTIIVECLFLDNKTDLEYLNLEAIAQGIVEGYRAYEAL